tara:strand:- start:850 stop:1794 length:945 start_codon:yes stop_codon:yes gene_type:complete
MSGFPRRRLIQAMAHKDVVGTTPVNWTFVLWRNPQTLSTRSLLALGFEPTDSLLTENGFVYKSKTLTNPGRVLFDELSRHEFGPIAEWFNQGRTVETEVAGKRVRVTGLVRLGPSFGADGNLITSRETFLNLLPSTPPGSIEIGLVRLKPDSDASKVSRSLQLSLPNDVKVLTLSEFIEFEKNYWRSSTSIGFIFSLGAAMGFVVGCVIVYQILYSDVSDHLAEYATLMAMGYRIKTLLGVVAREGVILSIMGYLPAYLSGQGLYSLVRNSTDLPVIMTLERSLLVFILILVMCMGSAFVAMRRLTDADPAEIF